VIEEMEMMSDEATSYINRQNAIVQRDFEMTAGIS
jgi:hypothetical protein